ncbi:MAG: hypothetical protein LUH01_15315 [Parabacteroides gordonii]|nr:hypothetical protein [Parabacteroides gordonii]
MDKLKNFIDTNKEAFEDDLLPEGHFERFEKKLPPARRNRFGLYSLCAFAAAASIALLFLFRLPGGTPAPLNQQTTVQKTCQAKTEIDELRVYYNMQMDDILAKMETLYKQEQAPGAAGLLQESRKILKDNHMFEETILPTLPCSNDALFAMNQHYSTSIETLNFMLEQMERVTTDNENENK